MSSHLTTPGESAGFAFESMTGCDLSLPRDKFMPYHTVEEIIEHLDTAVERGDLSEARWLPGRLVQAVINDKIERPSLFHVEEVEHATGMAIGFYAGTLSIGGLRDYFATLGQDDDFMYSYVKKMNDSATREGTEPRNCEATANLIMQRADREPDVLAIPLAGGGVVAGIQTLLYYRAVSGSADSVVYPVRFSHYKSGDPLPHVTQAETEHLRSLVGDGLRPVIINEDTAKGTSLRIARQFFGDMFGRNVEAVYCHDVTRGFGSSSPTAGIVRY